MTDYNPNRYRVSTKLIGLKIIASCLLAFCVYGIIASLIKQRIEANYLILGPIGLLMFYFSKRVKLIEYDDIEHILYIMQGKSETAVAVPVEQIDKIVLSGFQFKGMPPTYVITYRDEHSQQQSVRLVTIPLSHHIDTIIVDTQLKNPNVKVRSWHVMGAEIFD